MNTMVKKNSIIRRYAIIISMILISLFMVGCMPNENGSVENNKVLTEKVENDSKDNENQEGLDKEQKNLPIKLTEGKVTRVVDGDTAVINIKGKDYKVRFIGINTPESTTRHEPYGKEASNYTKDKLTGKKVYLEKDVSDTDRYGRLLRYVWLSIPKEISDEEIRSKMFNAMLAIDGYAQQSTYPPDVKYKDCFGKYAIEARKKGIGLWAIDPKGTTKGDKLNSDNVNRSINGQTSNQKNNNESKKVNNASNSNEVVITAQGKKYHKTNCKFIKKIKEKITKEEAEKRGYEPCKNCNP